MRAFTLVHQVPTDVDRFWELFFDQEYCRAQFVEGLGFTRYEILVQTQTEREIYRKVVATPKVSLPAPVAKLIGPGFTYTEEGTFDRIAKVWRWKNVPDDKLENGGTMCVEPASQGCARLVSSFEIKAKMFGIGSLLESTLEKYMRQAWDRSSLFMHEWLGQPRPPRGTLDR